MPIRDWEMEDLPRVNELLGKLSRSIGFDYHDSVEVLKDHFLGMRQSPAIYATSVYTVDARVVALVSVIFYRSALGIKGTALVTELVVDDGFRNKGIGRELLDHCAKLAEEKGYDEIEVGVGKANLDAIRFYKRNGMDKEYVLLGRDLPR